MAGTTTSHHALTDFVSGRDNVLRSPCRFVFSLAKRSRGFVCPPYRCLLVEKMSIGPTDHSEDVRDIGDVLDRILDKGLVVDPAYRLTLMDTQPPREQVRFVVSLIQTCAIKP